MRLVCVGFVSLAFWMSECSGFVLPEGFRATIEGGSFPRRSRILKDHEWRPIAISPRRNFQHATKLHEASSNLPAFLEENFLISTILTSPIFWCCAILVSIISLLFVWEEVVCAARKKLPSTLMPVLDSMLAEMGALGFIGIFLTVFVIGGPLGMLVGELSDIFLGEEEILLESFESLHEALFEIAIAYYLAAGAVVYRVLGQIALLQDFSLAIFDLDGDGDVSLDEIAEFLGVEAIDIDQNGDGVLDDSEIALAIQSVAKPSLWSEMLVSSDRIRAEAMIVRERFIETCRLSPTFKIEDYFVPIFGSRLEDLVEISPLIWIPMIPAISFDYSIDISHHVVSPTAGNAFQSCGAFLSDPIYFLFSSILTGATLTWGIWNFWKVTTIKHMLLPVLVKDTSSAKANAMLLPPRYEDKHLLQEFDSSPLVFGWIESFFGKPAQNGHEKLFGKVGSAGPKVYLKSIQLQIWVQVNQIVFWGYEIIARDVQALSGSGVAIADDMLVKNELVVFAVYAMLSLAQLLLAPQTFLNYCIISSIERLTDECVIQDAFCSLDAAKVNDTFVKEELATN